MLVAARERNRPVIGDLPVMKNTRSVSIGKKMYLFVILSVLVAVLGTAGIAYYSNSVQIDNLYKATAENTAVNLAELVDADFVAAYRDLIVSDEYQEIRARAEREQDESLVLNYFREKGLEDQLEDITALLGNFCKNIKGMSSIYIASYNLNDGEYSYLISASNEEYPAYLIGLGFPVESEFEGVDPTKPVEATISYSEWGWFCSSFAPVCIDDKSLCVLGADVSMNVIMSERISFLVAAVLGGLAFVVVVLAIAVRFINKALVRPLNSLTTQMKNFKPSVNKSYEEANIVNLDIHSNDEIQHIYEGIRAMQIDIVDYINHMVSLQRDNEQAHRDIQEKDKQITEIHRDAYADSLTGVGSKSAYQKAVNKLNESLAGGTSEFAVVMMDINNLKMVNDNFGHEPGDLYIQGCCRLLCDTFSHSPVYRIGGDEFVAILSERDYEDREERIASLKAAFASSSVDSSREPWERYSASIGSAVFDAGDESFEQVFKRADNAMYQEKEAFRKEHGRYR